MSEPTYYTLTIPGGQTDIPEVALQAGKLLSPSRDWQETLRGDHPEVWPNHQEDMSRLSTEWPGVTLVLRCSAAGPPGPDEKPRDHPDFTWLEYYRDGLVQKEQTRIATQGFNPDLLRDPHGGSNP